MALAIFSIGILAVASLQISAILQSRNSSEMPKLLPRLLIKWKR